MDFQQLKTFLAVAELGSFTSAAAKLDYAQSSVSEHMRLLENQLQARLFERLGRKVMLTAEGERFLRYAKQIIELTAEAESAMQAGGKPRGKLAIAAPETLSIYRLPALMKEYHRLFPEVELSLRLDNCCAIWESLRRNELDVAFLLDQPNKDEHFETEILWAEPLVLVSAPEQPLSGRDAGISPADLEGQSLLLAERGGCYCQLLMDALTDQDVHPGSILDLGSVEAIKRYVASGLGVAMLPRITVQAELEQGVLADLVWTGPNIEVFTQIARHKDKWLSPALAELLKIARSLAP